PLYTSGWVGFLGGPATLPKLLPYIHQGGWGFWEGQRPSPSASLIYIEELPMTETVPTVPGGDRTDADFLARAPELRRLTLSVVEVAQITPRARRLRLTGADLAGFSYAAGQDLMVLVDTSGGRIIR